MKLSLIAALLLSGAGQQLFAQPVEVKGVVKTPAGDPVFNASVKAPKEKQEVFTDPQGNFDIRVSPNSSVMVSFAGYEPASIKVRDAAIDTVLIIELEKNRSGNTEQVSEERKKQDLAAATSSGGNSAIYGSSLGTTSFVPSFSHKENTQGSKYLFQDWVKGHVVNANQALIDNPGFLYNYDKMSGDLLLTQDKRSAIAVGKEQISSFTLEYPGGDSVMFKMVPALDDKHFTAILAQGPNYTLYRTTKTKFNKADYHTDGMTETGNNFDEYADAQTYYLQQGTAAAPMPVKLSKKAFKSALSGSKAALQYLAAHDSDIVNEQFAMKLVTAANQ